MDKTQYVVLTGLISLFVFSQQVEARFLNEPSHSYIQDVKNSNVGKDRFFEKLHQLGIKPYYLIVCFCVFVAFDILVCWACSGCSGYFQRNDNSIADVFTLQDNYTAETNINGEARFDIIEESSTSAKYPPFLRSCPSFAMQKLTVS
ncbi:hypothetical protein SteCoe_31715 [Stentor coeruleus]|uniref:Uncharacterized protein n=1 Tax=Stentor coeruleus TaxID=5963 RepID=A0A1R2B0Q3_9CILI|nr:hypothetical protein SteCoe_31715 [Stentor coeruleus]